METKLQHIFIKFSKKYGIVFFLTISFLLLFFLFIDEYFETPIDFKESADTVNTVNNNYNEYLSKNGEYRASVNYDPSNNSTAIKVTDMLKKDLVVDWNFNYGYPIRTLKWVNNKYIYTERGCGTACTAPMLLNIETKEVMEGLIMQIPNENNTAPRGFFRDFSSKEYWFDDVIGNIIIVDERNKLALLLNLVDFNTNNPTRTEKIYLDINSLPIH